MTDETKSVIGWYVVDHARNNRVVRGPYKYAETAHAVRDELERTEDKPDVDWDELHLNLWVVECKTDEETRNIGR